MTYKIQLAYMTYASIELTHTLVSGTILDQVKSINTWA